MRPLRDSIFKLALNPWAEGLPKTPIHCLRMFRLFVAASLAVVATACGSLTVKTQDPPNKAKLAAARFEALCKGSGMRVVRTVDDVRAIVLPKVRPRLTIKDYFDPMLPGAAMALEDTEGSYIENFLGVETPPAERYALTFGARKPPSKEEIERRDLRGEVFVSPERIR